MKHRVALSLLLATSCSGPREPTETVERAEPFELLCKTNLFGYVQGVSFRVDQQSVLVKTEDEEGWKDVCAAAPWEQVLECRSDVADTEISIFRKSQAKIPVRTDVISIDRLTGIYSERRTFIPEQPIQEVTGRCMKSADRAF